LSPADFWRRALRVGSFWLDRLRWRFAYSGMAERFWDRQAREIHERWGRTTADFQVVGEVLDAVQARSVLDIGCGSGRLFPLYLQRKIGRIVGVDISGEALALAKADYPQVEFQRVSVLELSPENVGHFDLALTNRVLQHIPRADVARAVRAICAIGENVYVNELGATDLVPETYTMVRHDYPALFGENGFDLARQGVVGHQTYLVFRRRVG
jgi:SAM-dependent methyltransferase